MTMSHNQKRAVGPEFAPPNRPPWTGSWRECRGHAREKSPTRQNGSSPDASDSLARAEPQQIDLALAVPEV
ncbi:hypothetical protein C8Q74DRAFT_1289265 [Fomes fomentarius]|nr:hypothetical protein C8Q74DRAFT_1289265 [Fomes fomentarius]